ncbi:MAG: hypothetical protein IPL96_03840 [Holophagaceae bacterium]|nr:hypothetical protein [Holophagaceae bacterium]
MNKFAILFPAALIASAVPAQTPFWSQPKTPSLLAFTVPGGIIWISRNAYSVTVSPGTAGDLPTAGMVRVPSGTYCLTAVGERNRSACRVVIVP